MLKIIEFALLSVCIAVFVGLIWRKPRRVALASVSELPMNPRRRQ